MSAETVEPELLHDFFGFVDPDESEFLKATHHSKLRSLRELNFQPGEERVLALIIPPQEFPERGRQRDFQVHYQTDEGRPVPHPYPSDGSLVPVSASECSVRALVAAVGAGNALGSEWAQPFTLGNNC